MEVCASWIFKEIYAPLVLSGIHIHLGLFRTCMLLWFLGRYMPIVFSRGYIYMYVYIYICIHTYSFGFKRIHAHLVVKEKIYAL